jgi:hypothetical protein
MNTAWIGLALSLAAGVPTPRDLIEVGWENRFETGAGWQAEPWLAKKAGAAARFTVGADGGAFQVSTPGADMAWTLTTNPVWVEPFPMLEVRYRLQPAGGVAKLLLSDDSTGPITPGALNPENPLARDGQLVIELPAADRAVNLDLRSRFKSDRVARITFVVTAPANGPAGLVVERLAFRSSGRSASSRPSTQPYPLLTLDPLGAPATVGWSTLPIPGDAPISARMLDEAFGIQPFATRMRWLTGQVRVSGIPFRLGPEEHAAFATGIQQVGAVSVEMRARGSELALLLGTRQVGTDSPWTPKPRGPITSPHELAIDIEYADGTGRRCFPISVATPNKPGAAPALRRAFTGEDPPLEVGREPAAYVVPLAPDKELRRVSVCDGMTYGQVFLLAASIHESGAALLPSAPPPQPLPTTAPPTAIAAKPATVQDDDGRLTIENAWLRLVADAKRGLAVQSLTFKPLHRELIRTQAGATPPLVAVLDATNKPMQLRFRDMQRHQDGATVEQDVKWSIAGSTTAPASAGAADVIVKLRVRAGSDGRLTLRPTLANAGPTDCELALVCPQLGGLRVADDRSDCWYLLGTHSTVLDNRSYKLEEVYGGAFPLQLIDLFAPRAGGGLAMMVPDASLAEKTFRFQQTADAASTSVLYPRVRVPAGGEVALPETLLLLHLGDWHESFDAYRQTLRAASPESTACLVSQRLTAPDRAIRPGRMADVFYCRRDYPLGGTGYLFDPPARRYTAERLIDEAAAGFGGLDMIDISGWAYHEAIGRVGEYRTNDLGGLGELRRCVSDAHQRHAKLGLYFEGYLVDKRAPIAARALAAWQFIDKAGKPKWWPGDMELFVCPAVEKWQKELSQAVADVAGETGADAVYLDEFGFCGPDKACWSREHGHPVPSNPMLGETAMLRAVRRELDGRGLQRVGIYIEQVPCDAIMPLIDGALNYGMSATTLQHATKLPLHRFLFPEMSSMEMVSEGIRPLPFDEDDLQRCIFHGSAMWLKGRAASWYSPGFLETARRARPIFQKYAKVFASPDCTPLVPTLATGIYANRFATADAIVVTVYNAAYTEYAGDLLSTPAPAGWQVRDLWNDASAACHREGDAVVISGRVEPRSVGVFLVSKG